MAANTMDEMVKKLGEWLGNEEELRKIGMSEDLLEKLKDFFTGWSAASQTQISSPTSSSSVGSNEDHNYTQDVVARKKEDARHNIKQEHHDYLINNSNGEGYAIFELKNAPGTNDQVTEKVMESKAAVLTKRMNILGTPGKIRVEEIRDANNKGTGIFALIGPKDFVNPDNLNSVDRDGSMGFPIIPIRQKQATVQNAPEKTLTPEEIFKEALHPVAARASSAATANGIIADKLGTQAERIQNSITSKEKTPTKKAEDDLDKELKKATDTYLARTQGHGLGRLFRAEVAEDEYHKAMDKAETKFKNRMVDINKRFASGRNEQASLEKQSYDKARDGRNGTNEKKADFDAVVHRALAASGINFQAGMDAIPGDQIESIRQDMREAGHNLTFKQVENAVKATCQTVTSPKSQIPQRGSGRVA